MNARPLVIITTRLPPATCGIGSYSALLREHWPESSGRAEFLVMDSAAEARAARQADNVIEFNGSATILARELARIGSADVVLHYAARAYHRFGCPVWLPGVLTKWKRQFPGARLMLVAHELPGGEMPMTSRYFWLGKVDEWIVRRLAAAADVLVTNTEHHANRLRSISGRSNIQLAPVGSNIALVSETTAARAATEFALFGLPFGRWQTLQRFDADVRRWHASGRLTTLHIIGPAGNSFSNEADALISAWPSSITVIRHGMLPSAEVSAILQRARFALTNVTPETWSKSGAFMACAAHSCAVVVTAAQSSDAPFSYAIGREELELLAETEVDRRTAALRDWYTAHADWPVIATRLASLWQQEGGARVG